jgi:hypothetical protein
MGHETELAVLDGDEIVVTKPGTLLLLASRKISLSAVQERRPRS